jgi:DNA end-binding protein Ku
MAIKTSISFGLVYIPVILQNAIKNNDIGFNLIHKKYGSRIQYKKSCPGCEEEVKQSDIVKGYEYEDGKYVIFDDEDFDKIKSKKDKTVTIDKFVDISEIDPIYYEKAYYVQPAPGAERAFALLLKTLEEEGKIGIAKTVLGTKDSIIALRAKKGNMIMSTMYFEDEVQKNQYKSNQPEVNQKELELAKTIVKNMTGKFDISEYKDEYREKLQKAIEQKVQGKNIVVPKEKETHINVISLMDALQQSLNISKKLEKVKQKEEKKTAKKVS